MTPHALLFTLAAIGISETVYLIRKRLAAERPVCLLGEDCATVLGSAYNRIFVIHNDTAGLIFYIVIALIAAFIVIGIKPLMTWKLAADVLVASGVLFSLFLLYLQWKVIKAWCFWCVMSAMTVFAMAGILLTSDLLALSR